MTSFVAYTYLTLRYSLTLQCVRDTRASKVTVYLKAELHDLYRAQSLLWTSSRYKSALH